MPPTLNVLIAGGGIAGPALAFWLAGCGHTVTIVERAPELRATGAQIDLRVQGFDVVQKMGLLPAITAARVHEDGIAFVDAADRVRAALPPSPPGAHTQSMTAEFEIMRGDLVRILHAAATARGATYVFGTAVDTFTQDAAGVHVSFANGTQATYDVLVGADGQGSRIRAAIQPADAPDPKHSLGLYFGYYFVPRTRAETATAKIYMAPRSRAIMTRSHAPDAAQVYLCQRTTPTLEEKGIQGIPRAPVAEQKRFFRGLFEDAGWHAPRYLADLESAENWYCQEIVQIKTDTWAQGRVVLLADAAHCPSPMTGMGTTSAFVGAYVLAGEMQRRLGDLEGAFAAYDTTLRPFVDHVQKLPPLVDHLFFHKTRLGIWLFRAMVDWAQRFKVDRLLGLIGPSKDEVWTLPDYPELERGVV